MKNFLVLLTAALIIGVSGLTFAENEKETQGKAFTGLVDFTYSSIYVNGLTAQLLHNHSVIQPSLRLNYEPLGIYGKVWASYSPKGGFNSDCGDEVDYIVGITKEIGKFRIDTGYVYYDLYKVGTENGDLHGFFANVDFPEIFQVTPYVSLEGDIPVNKEVLEGGFLYRLGLRHTREIKKQPINIDLSLAGHDGAYGLRPEPVSSVKIILLSTFQIWKFDVTPQVNIQKRLGHREEEGGISRSKIWYGVSLSFPF